MIDMQKSYGGPMNLNRYEIFLKVAEVGNITKAAEVLHYTQAGISHAVAALEKETGVSLFLRSASGVTLTENGTYLFPYIQQLVNDQRGLAQAIYEVNHVVAGTLRLGTFASVSAQWVPQIIRGFQKKYPQVEFELIEGDYDDVAERIKVGKIDCGFLSAPVEEKLQFTSLYQDPLMVVLPPHHRLAEKEKLTLEDIQKEPFIFPIKGSDNDILAVLKDYLKKIHIRYTLESDSSIMSMVENGFGITIMTDLVLRNFNFHLVIRPLYPMKYRTLGIAALPEDRQTILTKTFIRYLNDGDWELGIRKYDSICRGTSGNPLP